MELWTPYLIAIGLILAVALAWIAVQSWCRRFSARHPEYGPHRECFGCGRACTCEDDKDNREPDARGAS